MGLLLPFLFFFVVALYFVMKYVRKHAMKELAARYGLRFYPRGVPPTMPSYLMDVLPNWQGMWNCVSGEFQGMEVVGFDYLTLSNRKFSIASAVAVNNPDFDSHRDFPKRFSVYQKGDWIIGVKKYPLLRPGTISKNEMAAFWKWATAPREHPDQSIVIRPRPTALQEQQGPLD